MVIIAARHADKETGDGGGAFDPNDPPLSKAGRERAQVLGRLVAPSGVSVVFHSDARRTRETAERVRDGVGGGGAGGPKLVEVPFAAGVPQQILRTVAQISVESAAAVVLLIGHSNTVGPTLNRLGAPDLVGDLDDDAFDDLFVLMRPPNGAATLVRMRYGAARPG